MNCLKETRVHSTLDAVRGDEREAVLEIVTFRLAPGASRETFLTSAAATEKWLRKRGAVRQRLLTEGDDGTWTDAVEWTSMEAAKSAGAEVMEAPDFAPFMQAIDPKSVAMRHETIRWRME